MKKSAITLHRRFSFWGRENKSFNLPGLGSENKLLLFLTTI